MPKQYEYRLIYGIDHMVKDSHPHRPDVTLVQETRKCLTDAVNFAAAEGFRVSKVTEYELEPLITMEREVEERDVVCLGCAGRDRGRARRDAMNLHNVRAAFDAVVAVDESLESGDQEQLDLARSHLSTLLERLDPDERREAHDG